MDDSIKIFESLSGVVGPTITIAIAVFAYLWTQRTANSKAVADADGQISAVNVYKELLATARAFGAEQTLRADAFAKERNEAVQQLYELKGQIKAMTEQIAKQNEELHGLRRQLDELKEQLDGKR